jgi:hypothetical protein
MRPEMYPVKKLIRIDEAINDGIERWRRQQTPVPTVTDAIRALIALGLAVPLNQHRLLYVLLRQGWRDQEPAGALQLHVREERRPLADRRPSFISDAVHAEITCNAHRRSGCGRGLPTLIAAQGRQLSRILRTCSATGVGR